MGSFDGWRQVLSTNCSELRLAGCGCLTEALDPLTIALLRPASELSNPEGQILSILVSSILDAFSGLPAAPSAAIRKFLAQSPLLSANSSDFTKALRRMHDLEQVKADAAREELLIDLLLTYYETNREASYPVQEGRAKATRRPIADIH
jgi:hypothetical protein